MLSRTERGDSRKGTAVMATHLVDTIIWHTMRPGEPGAARKKNKEPKFVINRSNVAREKERGCQEDQIHK